MQAVPGVLQLFRHDALPPRHHILYEGPRPIRHLCRLSLAVGATEIPAAIVALETAEATGTTEPPEVAANPEIPEAPDYLVRVVIYTWL